MTSQPSAASTRAVAALTWEKKTCCTHPESIPTRRRGVVEAIGFGREADPSAALRDDKRTVRDDKRTVRKDKRAVGDDKRAVGDDKRTVGDDKRTRGSRDSIASRRLGRRR